MMLNTAEPIRIRRTQKDIKPEEKKDNKSSELEISQDKAPQGKAKNRKALVLSSAKGMISFEILKGLKEANTKKVILLQNKVKITASITDKALTELVVNKVNSLAIKGKNFTLYLDANNIKKISRLVHKKIAFKVQRLKTGKFKIVVSIDGKKLTAKELAKLKLKIK